VNLPYMLMLLNHSRRDRTAKPIRRTCANEPSGCLYTINELRQMHGLPPMQPCETENREEELRQ
jgi:hypothetical protein